MGLISRVSSRTYRQRIMGRSRSRSQSRSRSRSRSRTRSRSPKKYHSSELHSVRIGNELLSDITENEIRETFDKFGEIGDVFLPKERGTDRTRGFGYVRFVRKDDADYCLKECADKTKSLELKQKSNMHRLGKRIEEIGMMTAEIDMIDGIGMTIDEGIVMMTEEGIEVGVEVEVAIDIGLEDINI